MCVCVSGCASVCACVPVCMCARACVWCIMCSNFSDRMYISAISLYDGLSSKGFYSHVLYSDGSLSLIVYLVFR